MPTTMTLNSINLVVHHALKVVLPHKQKSTVLILNTQPNQTTPTNSYYIISYDSSWPFIVLDRVIGDRKNRVSLFHVIIDVLFVLHLFRR